MPQSSRKKLLKIPFKPLDAERNDSQKTKGVNSIKSVSPSFDDPKNSKQPRSLPPKVLGNKLRRDRIVGGVPEKSTLNHLSGKILKSRNVSVNKLPMHNASLLSRKVSSSNIVTKTLMQKEHVAPRFLSILMDKGRLIRHKVTTQLLERKVWWNTEEVKRLPHAKRLQLFQTLLKEPLPFLDLHVRFGVSKQTIRRLVKNGILMEVWGPKAIGVRFKLSKKGKTYLKELEAAAKYDSKMKEKDFIRLKQGAPF